MDQSKNASDKLTPSGPESSSTRWWESYLVRYFVGFIVGTLCVGILVFQMHVFDDFIQRYLSATSPAKPDWTALVFVAGMLGIVYCYIASSPITVLHAGRNSKWFLDSHSRHFWFGWLILCIFLLIISIDPILTFSCSKAIIGTGFVALISWLPVNQTMRGLWGNDPEKNKLLKLLVAHPGWLIILQSILWAVTLGMIFAFILSHSTKKLDVFTIKLWLLGLPVIWIGLIQYCVLARLLVEEKDWHAFYAKLFSARRNASAKEVRDTYTHLREHSNSVFIVVVELAILAFLLAVQNTTYTEISPAADSFKDYGLLVMLGLAVWMLPTVFMWARANSLENEFSNHPSTYLKEIKKP